MAVQVRAYFRVLEANLEGSDERTFMVNVRSTRYCTIPVAVPASSAFDPDDQP